MKSNTKYLTIGAITLFMLTMACEVTLFSEAEDELTPEQIAMTSQVALQTSVAKTVEALGPAESNNNADKDESDAEVLSSGSAATTTPLPCNKPNFQSETIPDESTFEPGENFTKTWTVRNDGTCAWTTDYSLVFTSGDQMNGPTLQPFAETINPSGTITLRVDLTAPASSGTYTGTWKIRAGDGEEFGNYWATIKVGQGAEEASTDLAVTSVTFANSDQMKVGFCPHLFNLQAEITVNRKGEVKYHWVVSNGFESAVETLNFDSAGTKTAILSKNFSCSGTSTCSYVVVELYIDSPNHQPFGAWPIAIHCM